MDVQRKLAIFSLWGKKKKWSGNETSPHLHFDLTTNNDLSAINVFLGQTRWWMRYSLSTRLPTQRGRESGTENSCGNVMSLYAGRHVQQLCLGPEKLIFFF